MVHAVGREPAGGGARRAAHRGRAPRHGDRAHRRPARGRRGAAPRAGGAHRRAGHGLHARRAVPAVLLRRRHVRGQGERVAQAHRRAGGPHRQHRRPAGRRGLRPAAPQRAVRARPRLVGAALCRLSAGRDVPRQPREDAAVLVHAAAAPPPVRLARRRDRLVDGRPRRRGGHVPRRLPGDPAGGRPRGLPPGGRTYSGAAPRRLQRRRRAAQGARRAPSCPAPARRRARRRRRRRLRRRPPGAPLRAPGAAGLAGQGPLSRAPVPGAGRGAPARGGRLLRAVVRPRDGRGGAARGHGLRRRRRRLGDPRLRRGRPQRGDGAARPAARHPRARGGALAPARRRRASPAPGGARAPRLAQVRLGARRRPRSSRSTRR